MRGDKADGAVACARLASESPFREAAIGAAVAAVVVEVPDTDSGCSDTLTDEGGGAVATAGMLVSDTAVAGRPATGATGNDAVNSPVPDLAPVPCCTAEAANADKGALGCTATTVGVGCTALVRWMTWLADAKVASISAALNRPLWDGDVTAGLHFVKQASHNQAFQN